MSSRARVGCLGIWYILGKGVSTALFREERLELDGCAAHRERRTCMGKPIKTLLFVLLLLGGSTAYVEARAGHGGFHGGFRGGGFSHHHFIPSSRFGHVHHLQPHFHG